MKHWWLGFSTTIIGLCIFIKYTVLMILAARRNKDVVEVLDRFRDSIHMHCYSRLNLTTKVDDQLIAIPDEPIIIYGPHVDTMAIFCYYATLRTLFPGRRIIPIATKPEMKHLFGLISKAVKSLDGIMIDRDKPEEAIDIIRERAQEFYDPPVFVIFPDGHRIKPSRLSKAHDYLHSTGRQHLVQTYQHTLVPKTRGIQALRTAFKNPTCIRVSSGFDVRDVQGTFSSHKLIDATFLMKFEDTQLPTDIEKLKTQLIEKDFPEINNALEQHIGKREHAEYLKSKAT